MQSYRNKTIVAIFNIITKNQSYRPLEKFHSLFLPHIPLFYCNHPVRIIQELILIRFPWKNIPQTFGLPFYLNISNAFSAKSSLF